MKYILFLLSAALLGLTAFTAKTGAVLTGKVIDEKGEALIAAHIKVTKGSDLVQIAFSDVNGEYRVELNPGTYDVEFSYTGYEIKRIVGVTVSADRPTKLDARLKGGAVLDEVVVTGYRDQRTEAETSALYEKVVAAKSKERSAARGEKAKSAPPPPVAKPVPASGTTAPAPVKEDDVKIKGSRSKSTDVYVDGIRLADASAPLMKREEAPKPIEPLSLMMDKRGSDEPDPLPGGPAKPAPRAGLLTAGEWNDLHNWNKHWLDLQADGEIDAYQKMYRFYPKNRYAVLLQNEQELPISDAAVQLLDSKGTTVWETRTDNLGRAELWNGLNGDIFAGDLTLSTWIDGKKHELGHAKPFGEGLNRHKIQRECKHSNNLDVVWTVDATGSMGDELEYLKTELLDVIGRVKAANPGLAVRMGSVFYRDQGDDYIVKSSALNYDIAKTVDYIRKQSAGGGGDYPEAVHSALDEAIYRQPWSAEAVARICFLVLDASPHQDPAVLESIQKSIREAAKKGIRIVPVSASGIQKDTEFLMKFFGLATNGTYVFLTDHSGIGGKHLEPTTDEYTVELLNDLLVRLITEYTSVPTCEGKSILRFEDQQVQTGQQQNNGAALDPIVYYPNPASIQFTLELPFDADKVTLYDAEGKAVRTFAQLSAGTHRVPVNDLSEGFYTLRIWKGSQVQSAKVVVVRA